MSGSELAGSKMYALAERLFPICRSITGEGVRQSLRILQEYLPLEVHEIPTGAGVFDWTVPREWNIREAWVKDPAGNKVIDFQKNNLHLLSYSVPVHRRMSLSELKGHLFTLPEQPELIPYRTSYYKENWGFCLTHQLYETLQEGAYEVFIDSSLEDGHLSYGEYYLPGETEAEVLFSTHICHPSLANDNLSGISLLTFLAQELQKKPRRYSYRFLFIPGTIGAITWLARNEAKIHHIRHGLVASLLGDPGGFTYKRSRRGNTEIDRVAEHVLKHNGPPYQVIDFIPYGYDERQFCSPGFNLPVGSLTRSPFATFPEYHTSADNLTFIRPEYLQASFEVYRKITEVLEGNFHYINLNPKCEPQLGRRGLYDAIGGDSDSKALQMALLWVLNLSDGEHSLLDIAERAGYPFEVIQRASEMLVEVGLLAEVSGG
ncbi:MAG: DUF4910 domain-containing protein [Phaeodactylibacter sp.]|nr:DUF4910 domain-containing protein [Phaeodactylibacter sp.]